MRASIPFPDSPVMRERWEAKVNRNGPVPLLFPELDPCWVWTGSCDVDGYGRLGVRTERHRSFPFLAHRAAYEMFVGPIPAGLLVLHRCDNPPCVNPAHLFLGTQKDNVDDFYAKGYRPVRVKDWSRHIRGQLHVHAKLTEAQVLEIRAAVAAGGATQSEIGARYSIGQQLVSDIWRGKRWAHLKQP